jgi:hypothetical protein
VKRIIRKALGTLAPGALDWIRAYRFRRRCKELFWDFQTKVAGSIYTDGRIHVLSGPFAGMAYFNEVVWGPITPKWIGSYEEELHPVISQEILTAGYRTIVDIGAAEGYYAVGLARARPEAQVFSFDIDPFARSLQRRLSNLNDVHNLTIGKRCSHQNLNELLAEGGLVISDIEGFEYELLDPDRAPGLRRSDLLVELHQFGARSLEQVREELRARFAATHQARLMAVRARDLSRYERWCGPLVDGEVLKAALDEHRNPRQEWLWLKAV